MTVQESLVNSEIEIKEYLLRLKSCYAKAIVKYNEVCSAFAEPMFNRTKSANFQNIIINRIKEEFSDCENVTIIEKFESISLVFNNYISARFKKFNSKGFPSNHQSKRNDAIISQCLQMEIGYLEYPPMAHIDVGYTFDALGNDYEFLKIMCRKGKEIIWDLFFHDAKEDNNNNNVVANPVQPVPPTPPNRLTFIKKHKKIEEND